MTRQAPCGSWQSTITADMMVEKSIRLFDVKLVEDHLYWLEMRPAEEGRYVLMGRGKQGRPRALVPKSCNVRTLVHEYGGNPYGVAGRDIIFVNFEEQRLHVWDRKKVQPLMPANHCRYADFAVRPHMTQVYAVREDHSLPHREAVNSLVMLDLGKPGTEVMVASDHDFYSSPCVSPDGTQVAWLAWNHPAMPWDETELWLAQLDDDGEPAAAQCLWRAPDMSLFQPSWSPDGILHCVSDQSGWWNLYRFEDDGPRALCPREAEFGTPQWVFGLSTYAFIDADRILCTWCNREGQSLGILDISTGTLTPIETEYTSFSGIQADAQHAAFLAASPTQFTSLVLMELDSGKTEVVRQTSRARMSPNRLSVPQAIHFPTEGGHEAHAYFYPPVHPDFEVPADELPPLLVKSHGGPTSATDDTLNLGIQYWTSRGFAVVDVNYGGSTGYGTAYRRRLNGAWGIVDVQDCANAARYLVQEGLVDPDRLAITGGSAGGYTTLACLAFTDVFHAGISHYGVSDLGALARETHKFESRYLDSLIGPYPAEADLYDQRSPLKSAEAIACPILFLQGLEDRIVLPNQAEMMVNALRRQGIPVAYLPFEGEQHGFRQAHNIKAAILAETYFLSRMFGFEPADDTPALRIENWPLPQQ